MVTEHKEFPTGTTVYTTGVRRHSLRRNVQHCSGDVRRCDCFSSGKLPK